MVKRTQHVAPNNVAICCVGMLRSFGRGLSKATVKCLNNVAVKPQNHSVFQPVGCYEDNNKDRALPDLYLNIRLEGGIQWYSPRHGLDLVVKQCAEKAYKMGYEYFGVQNYGECHGKGTNYTKHGVSHRCHTYDREAGHAVGISFANFVYHLIKQL